MMVFDVDASSNSSRVQTTGTAADMTEFLHIELAHSPRRECGCENLQRVSSSGVIETTPDGWVT
jgi:hypothetical protein